MRRIYLLVVLLTVMADGLCQGAEGPWPVHYLPPVGCRDMPSGLCPALDGHLRHLVSSLYAGVIYAPPLTRTPGDLRTAQGCRGKGACLLSALRDEGVSRVVTVDLQPAVEAGMAVLTVEFNDARGGVARKAHSAVSWPALKEHLSRLVQEMVLDREIIGADLSSPDSDLKALAARMERLPGLWPEKTLLPHREVILGSEAPWCPDCRPVTRHAMSPLLMDRSETPLLAYLVCVLKDACTPPGDAARDAYCSLGGKDGLAGPVNCITWTQARQYCTWRGGRLPTEAEWESASSRDDGRLYPWGDELPTCPVTHFSDAAGDGCGHDRPRSFDGAGPGVVDLSGNLWEWVADWYQSDAYRYRQTDDRLQGPAQGIYRVIRGGSWLSKDPHELSLRHRGRRDPESGSNALGFRCVYQP